MDGRVGVQGPESVSSFFQRIFGSNRRPESEKPEFLCADVGGWGDGNGSQA